MLGLKLAELNLEMVNEQEGLQHQLHLKPSQIVMGSIKENRYR